MQKFAQYGTSTWEIMCGNHTIYSIDFNTKESIEFTSGKIKIMIDFEVMPFDMINKIAKKYNKNASQIVLRWNIENGYIPVPGSRSKEHIIENFDIFNFY